MLDCVILGEHSPTLFPQSGEVVIRLGCSSVTVCPLIWIFHSWLLVSALCHLIIGPGLASCQCPHLLVWKWWAWCLSGLDPGRFRPGCVTVAVLSAHFHVPFCVTATAHAILIVPQKGRQSLPQSEVLLVVVVVGVRFTNSGWLRKTLDFQSFYLHLPRAGTQFQVCFESCKVSNLLSLNWFFSLTRGQNLRIHNNGG